MDMDNINGQNKTKDKNTTHSKLSSNYVNLPDKPYMEY